MKTRRIERQCGEEGLPGRITYSGREARLWTFGVGECFLLVFCKRASDRRRSTRTSFLLTGNEGDQER